MSNNKVTFPEGIRVFAPGGKSPDFVKGQLMVNKKELINWLHSQDNEIRLDIKQSKKGSWYLSVSDFTPKEKGFYKKSDFVDKGNVDKGYSSSWETAEDLPWEP